MKQLLFIMAEYPNDQAIVPNPFFDPRQFQDLVARKKRVVTSGTTKQMPNPFFDPHQFASERLLVTQIIKTHAPATSQNNKNIDSPDNDPLSETVNTSTSSESGNPFLNPLGFLAKREQLKSSWNAIFEAVNDISVLAVAEHLDGIGNQDGDRSKYKISGDNVLFNGQKWWNTNAGEGGVGPVSLLMAFSDISTKQAAIIKLATIFKNEIGTDAIRARPASESREKPVFEAPENAPHFLDDIRAYLRDKRGIDSELIERLIREGRVYSDLHRNVVMISKTGQIAELRGIEPYKDWKTDTFKTTKMLKPGSEKSSGAFLVSPDPDKIKAGTLKSDKAFAIVEAGIDAMSYHMLYPGRAVASASGAEFNYPRKIFFECHANGYSYHCAFDADLAGDKASQNIYNSAALFKQFSEQYGISKQEDFLALFSTKTLRLKLRPELHTDTSNLSQPQGDEEDDLTENVLFFGGDDIFHNPNNPPKIKFQVGPNQLGIKTGHQELIITPEMHESILKTFKLHRDRPGNAKDWNDLVKPKTNNMPKYT